MRGAVAISCGLMALSVAACASTDGAAPVPFTPEYNGVRTALLEGDLVNFLVEMKGARGAEDLEAYAECAAAQYALIRGYGFARHVRTNVDNQGSLWRADAVYTISPALPRGLSTIDAEVTVQNCAENGIPTV